MVGVRMQEKDEREKGKQYEGISGNSMRPGVGEAPSVYVVHPC